MGTWEDHERFVAGEVGPMSVGFRKVAFEHPVRTFVSDDEREVRSVMRADSFFPVERPNQDCKRIGAHRFDEERAVGNLVESWRVHWTPEPVWMGFLFNVNGPATMPQPPAGNNERDWTNYEC